MIPNRMQIEAAVISTALDWAAYQEPDSLADQQTDAALRRRAMSAKLLLICAIERYSEAIAALNPEGKL